MSLQHEEVACSVQFSDVCKARDGMTTPDKGYAFASARFPFVCEDCFPEFARRQDQR